MCPNAGQGRAKRDVEHLAGVEILQEVRQARVGQVGWGQDAAHLGRDVVGGTVVLVALARERQDLAEQRPVHLRHHA